MTRYYKKSTGANGSAVGAREGNRRAPKNNQSDNSSFNPNWLTRGLENFTRTKMERKDAPFNWFNHKEVITSPHGDFDPTEGYIPFTNSSGRFLTNKQKKEVENNTLRSDYTKQVVEQGIKDGATSLTARILLNEGASALPLPPPLKIGAIIAANVFGDTILSALGSTKTKQKINNAGNNIKRNTVNSAKNAINSFSDLFDMRGLRDTPVTKRLQKRSNKYFK